MNEPQPLREISGVVGANAKRLRLRGGFKAEDVARAVSDAGMKWGTGRVADLEAGRVSPTMPTLYVLAQAFSDLLGRPVGMVADLLAGDGQVKVTKDLTVELADFRASVRGRTQPTPGSAEEVRDYVTDAVPRMVDAISQQPPGRYKQLWRIRRDCGLAEERAARALGVEMDTLTKAMADLWTCTLSQERDRLAGPDVSAQKRGQITRQLRQQLQDALGQEPSDGHD